MALLKDLLVNGVSRLIGDVFLNKLDAPTASNSTTYGLGTDSLVLRSNGSSIYWGDLPLVDTAHGGTNVAYSNSTGPAANLVFASDSTSTHTAANNDLVAPKFRALVAADLPTVPVTKGGTGMTTATNKNAVVIGNSTTVTNAMQTVRTKSGAFYATALDAKPNFGTLPVALGGTGLTTATYKNAVVIGNGTTVTNAMLTVRTASGAFYATAQDSAPLFGVLPTAQGGTGANINLTQNGLIYANTTSSLASTGAGTTGLFLKATSNNAPSWANLTIQDIPYGTGIIYCESASDATALTGIINKEFDGTTEDEFLIIFKNSITPTSTNLSSFTFSLNNTTALRLYFGTDNGYLNNSVLKGPLSGLLYKLSYHIDNNNKYYVLSDASTVNITLDTNDHNIKIGHLSTSLLPTVYPSQGGTGIAYSDSTGPTANLVFASDPDSSHDGTSGNEIDPPSFRPLVANDIPNEIGILYCDTDMNDANKKAFIKNNISLNLGQTYIIFLVNGSSGGSLTLSVNNSTPMPLYIDYESGTGLMPGHYLLQIKRSYRLLNMYANITAYANNPNLFEIISSPVEISTNIYELNGTAYIQDYSDILISFKQDGIDTFSNFGLNNDNPNGYSSREKSIKAFTMVNSQIYNYWMINDGSIAMMSINSLGTSFQMMNSMIGFLFIKQNDASNWKIQFFNTAFKYYTDYLYTGNVTWHSDYVSTTLMGLYLTYFAIKM